MTDRGSIVVHVASGISGAAMKSILPANRPMPCGPSLLPAWRAAPDRGFRSRPTAAALLVCLLL